MTTTLAAYHTVCAACHRRKDPDGTWRFTLLPPPANRTTHGLCPDCASRLYPEFFPAAADRSATVARKPE